MTAKEWRDRNPDLSGNIRDYVDILHLIVLANLETLNADMISENISQYKRLEKLNNTARKQLELLKRNKNIQRIKNIDNRLKLESKKLEV